MLRARTLEEGLTQLAASVDCVLLDLGLPDAVGVDSVSRVRAAAPWIAVIVFTGLDEGAAGEAAMEAGAQDYLVKGKVDGGLLARAIRYAVGRRHAEDVYQQLRVAEVRADENARLERGLVPHPILTDPSLWIASSYLPGRRRALLGGDFYDAVETSDGCLHVIVGDVSGRGPDEAALGAALRIAWRALILAGVPGDVVLDTLQRMIEHERRDLGDVRDLVHAGDRSRPRRAAHAPRRSSRPGADRRRLDREPPAGAGRATDRDVRRRAVARVAVRPPARLGHPALHRRDHRGRRRRLRAPRREPASIA